MYLAGKHSQNKHRKKELATSVSFKIDLGFPPFLSLALGYFHLKMLTQL